MDDAAQLWTTGVNVGSQVKKKKQEDEVLLSVVRESTDYNDIMFTLVPNSDFSTSFSGKLLHITSSGRSGFVCGFCSEYNN